MAKKLLVIGSINMDLLLRTTRFPVPGESFLGEEYNWIPGGKGANQAICASRIGAETMFLGCVGEDLHGRQLVENLEKNGIHIDSIQYSKETDTGLAVVMVEDDGENRIIVFPGANMELNWEVVDSILDRVDKPEGILINFEICTEVIEHTIKLAVQKQVPIFVDAGPARSDLDLQILRGVTVLSPNLLEMSEILSILGRKSDLADLDEIKKEGEYLLHALEASYLLIKLGRKGAIGIAHNNTTFIPAFDVQTVDSTAAGDAFTAAFSVKYLESDNFKESIVYGCAAGALATTKEGAEPSLPTAWDINEFIYQYNR